MNSKNIGLISGPLAFIFILLFFRPEGLNPQANAVLASTIWIAIWWITEALPISATSLLPLVAFPALGVMTVKEAATAYSHPIVLLIFGGFIIAAAMQKWNLHKRIALNILNKTGTRPNMLIAGFMLSTASISMWTVSYTHLPLPTSDLV